MKNNSLFINLFAVLVVFGTTNTAFASSHVHLKPMAINLLLVMFGIVFFTVIITIGLSVYNRFFVSSQIKDFNIKKDSLRSFTDKDEAILMFITKNRLK